MNNYNISANSDNNSDNYSTNSLVINDQNDHSAANGINSSSNNAHFNNSSSNNKYDKLVQDYVKLRSKLTILKKAYVELSDSSSQKDQSLRKYEQEIEGLNFRNQQLTSRVEILQRELENLKHSPAAVSTAPVTTQSTPANNAQSTSSFNVNSLNVPHSVSLSPSSGSLSSSSTSTSSLPLMAHTASVHQKTYSPALDVLTEELQRKINENALLHSRISELELDWKQKSSRLEQMCTQLENEKLTIERKLSTAQASSKSLIEKLQNDKIKLELNTIQMENELKLWQQNHMIKQSTVQMVELNHKKDTVNENIMQSVNENYLFGFFEQHIENFSKVYAYLAERLAQSASESSRSALKCEQLFSHKLVPLLKNRLTGQTLVEHSEFNRFLVEFFELNSNLIEQILSNDQQFDRHTDELETIHKKLRIYLNKINNFLFVTNDANNTNFSLSLNQLFSYMLFGIKPDTAIVQSTFNVKFISDLGSFIDILDKILFVYSEKLSAQYTLNFSASLNTADECLVSYLTQFKQSLYQLLIKLKDANPTNGILELAFRINQSIEKSNKSAVTVLNPVKNDPEIESLRANLATKEQEMKQLMEKVDRESTESDRLKFKLDQMQTLYDRLQEKEQQQQEIIQMLNTQNQEHIDSKKAQEIQMKTNEVVNLNNEKELENIKIDFYIKKVNSLNEQIQFLDSKLLFYYEELKSLSERLRLQTDLNNLQENDLNEVRDQLERTRHSYELQMSTMSDHLIEMNDKMARQADENEKLKNELNTTTLNLNTNNSKNSKTKKSK